MNSLRKEEYVKRKSWHDRFLQLSSYLKLCALVCFTRNFSGISDCIQRKLSRPRMSQYSESSLQNPKTPKRRTKSMSNRKGSDINFLLENLWMSSVTLLTHYGIQITTPWGQLFTRKKNLWMSSVTLLTHYGIQITTPWGQLFTSAEIMTVTVFEYLIFISIFFFTILFLRFLFSFSFHYEDISSTQDSVWPHFETPRSWPKLLRYASYFQLSSRCQLEMWFIDIFLLLPFLQSAC